MLRELEASPRRSAFDRTLRALGLLLVAVAAEELPFAYRALLPGAARVMEAAAPDSAVLAALPHCLGGLAPELLFAKSDALPPATSDN